MKQENTYLFEVSYENKNGERDYERIRATTHEHARRIMENKSYVVNVFSVVRWGN